MAITPTLTLNPTIRLTDSESRLLSMYSHLHAEKRDDEGSRRYDMNTGQTADIRVLIDDKPYTVAGTILIPGDREQIIAWVKVERPGYHYVFVMSPVGDVWDVMVDALWIEDDDNGTINDFLNLPINKKRELLGL